MTDDQLVAQDRIYASSLAKFDPLVVKSACDEWSSSNKFWPELSELLALCLEQKRLAAVARSLPNPGRNGGPDGEDFYARCHRLGRDSSWMRRLWTLGLEDLFREHLDGKLTDDRLLRWMEAMDHGRRNAA
jgi:hypothetical protein